MNSFEGRILKGIGGFYYVENGGCTVECKARGIFRKTGETPLPGDIVVVGEDTNSIEKILKRKNALIRPALANLDLMFVVAAAESPMPNYFALDKLLAVCENNGVEPVILLNKTDLSDNKEFFETYKKTGYKILNVSAENKTGINEIKREIAGKVCAFAGNSGVGKSSLFNALSLDISMEVGEISRKIERGRHTTRHIEIVPAFGGYIADTPGFGDIGADCFKDLKPEEVKYCFTEFFDYEGKCKFTDCMHNNELGCAVCAAVDDGEISRSRFESYLLMLEEARKNKKY